MAGDADTPVMSAMRLPPQGEPSAAEQFPAVSRAGPPRPMRARGDRAGLLIPALAVLSALGAWEAYVRLAGVPHYILPAPSRVLEALIEDRAMLGAALGVTLTTAMLALLLAALGGGLIAVAMSQSRFVNLALSPFTVVLQVTPIVAIAPLIFIYVDSRLAGLLVCAWLVAFFPVLSNTLAGLGSVDRRLHDLLTVHGATRWQRLRLLMLPAALPHFLGGLRIAGGLSLIGAVVAEYVAGTAGIGSGLAFRILEASYRLNIPRMFAALVLIAVAGVLVHASLSWLTRRLLRRWHDGV